MVRSEGQEENRMGSEGMVLATGEEGTGSSRMQWGVGGGHRGLMLSSFCLRSKE